MTIIPNTDRDDKDSGVVFNIQKFSLHDGSGIRTLVFLKGCPLKCTWCANPEGQSYSPELGFTESKCIGTRQCDMCRQVCETGAIQKDGDGKVTIDRNLCNLCGGCVEVCPAKALELFGREMQVAEVVRVVEEDSGFYSRSGGGVTLGGGEPLSQADFAARFLKKAKTRGIHTAIETCGHCDWADLEMVCRYVNQIFFDIKSMDSVKHKRHTGVSNRLILENFYKLCNAFPETPIVVRTPVIPGFNATKEDIREIVDYLNGVSGTVLYELLPYHGFGEQKYLQIGKPYQLSRIKPPTAALMNTLNSIAVLRPGETADVKGHDI